jgi:DNA modification methylase
MKEERIGPHRLFLGDCMDVMPTLGPVDAIVTDPPYGIGADRNTRANTQHGKALAPSRDYGFKEWDRAAPDMKWAASAGVPAIVWGGNYFDLPPSSCWLVWDKENGDNGYADCELAWTNLPKAVRRIRHLWHGMLRKGGEERIGHPTQKPVGVMEWCIGHLPDTARTILDPFAGSGTTGVACQKLGRTFIGIEKDPDYFAIMCKRIDEAMRQPDLFIAPPPQPKQESLF